MKNTDTILVWVYSIGTIALMTVSVLTTFRNPEMTQTELFIEYWPVYAITMAWVIGFGVILDRLNRTR